MAKTHPPYAPEFRRQMVELVRAGRDPADLAREFEPSSQAIRNWVARADRQDGRREAKPAADAGRRAAAGIPETVGFLTKPEIALEQIQAACAAGLPRGVVLMDAGYGTNTWLREEIGALGLSYVAGIPPQTSVWPPGTAPLPPLPWSGRGRRRDGAAADAGRSARSDRARPGLPRGTRLGGRSRLAGARR